MDGNDAKEMLISKQKPLNMSSKTLLYNLREDCRDWISSNKKIFLNEHDMQGDLANYLSHKRKHYDNVYVEYSVLFESLRTVARKDPRMPIVFAKSKGEFPWEEDLFIDIVVEKDKQFAAVELKYATAKLDPDTVSNSSSAITIFRKKTIINIVDVIKNTGAQNDKLYKYWKDVRRIEALTRFPKVVGGIALFVTNDSIYWNEPQKNAVYYPFSTHETHEVRERLNWGKPCEMRETHPSFKLDGAYYCHWEDTQIEGLALKGKGKEDAERSFRYIMSVFPPKSIKQQIKESKED